jgi:hypothetical protein
MKKSKPNCLQLETAWEAILDLAEAAYKGCLSNQEVIDCLRAQASRLNQVCQNCPPVAHTGLQRLLHLIEEPIEQAQAWQPIDWAEWLADIPPFAQLGGKQENGERDDTDE